MWTHYILLFMSFLTRELAEPAPAPAIDEPALVLQVSAGQDKQPAKPPRATRKARAKAPAAKEPVVKEPVVTEPVVSVAPVFNPQPMQVAVAPTAVEVVKKVQGFYNTTKSFKASFHQTVTNSTFNKLKPKTSKGKVYILKPGRMRWDYKNKSYRKKSDPRVSKSFISDGTHLWAVMHKNKQYYKENLQQSTLPVAVSFLMGTGNLLKEFDAKLETPGKYGSKSDILLLLTPKKPSARYKKLWLVVDSKTFAVKQSVVLNSKGDTNSIRFSSVKIDDGSLRKGHFIFNAKANRGFRRIKRPNPRSP